MWSTAHAATVAASSAWIGSRVSPIDHIGPAFDLVFFAAACIAAVR